MVHYESILMLLSLISLYAAIFVGNGYLSLICRSIHLSFSLRLQSVFNANIYAHSLVVIPYFCWQELMPGGVNSPVRAFKSVGGQPIIFESVKGSHMRDIDGNDYIDYVGSWGPAIIGHADDEVSQDSCLFTAI